MRKFSTFLALFSIGTAFVRAGEEPQYAPDMVRGFNESARCITTTRQPSEWCIAFRSLLRQRQRETRAFLLGMNFGFSLKSEPTAEAAGALESELRAVAKCAVIARVKYEALKRELRLTDAAVASVLRISPEKFSAWKTRAETSDWDHSLIENRPRIRL